MGEQISNMFPGSQGAGGIYGTMNEDIGGVKCGECGEHGER